MRKNGGKKGQKNFNKKYRNQRAKRVETSKREAQKIAIRNSTDGAGTAFSANYPSLIKQTPITTGEAVTMLPLRSFYRMSKGARPDQMIGNEIFHKALYAKVKVEGLPANNSIEMYVIHGWITDKLGYTDFTTPSVATATRQNLEDFVLHQIKQRFDETQDEMRFADRKLDNIKILGYRKLQHSEDASYNNSVDFKCSWRTNRKVAYTKCYQPQPAHTGIDAWAGNNSSAVLATGSVDDYIDMTDSHNDIGQLGGDIGQYLPLNSFLPFMCLYCPQFATVSPGSVTVGFNDVSYFNTN